MSKTNLLQRAKATAEGNAQAADESAVEGIRIGAAAERKRREETGESIGAILASGERHGRAVYWERRQDGRAQLVAERSGAYSERGFLRLAREAAEQAGRGRWRRPEAVETVAAELVARILAKTQGRMPAVGSLGRHAAGHENPDLAYLTASAQRIIASATRGDAAAAGLAAEAASDAVSVDGETLASQTLAEIAAEAQAGAEGARDPYLEAGSGDFLNPAMRRAAENLAALSGKRPKAVLAAIVAAMRPELHSADLADAGYAASPGAARVAAHTGRAILRDALAKVAILPESTWSEADRAAHDALAALAREDAPHREGRHPMSEGPMPYRAPKLDWPVDTDPVPRAERR